MKAVVLGFYGAGNAGDELLACVAGTWLTEFGVSPVFTSFDVDRSRSMFPQWEFVDIQDLSLVADQMMQADLFVLGGGGIFQEHNKLEIDQLYSFPGRDVAIFAQICLMARQFELPALYWAAGVGPLFSKHAQDLVADLFLHADAISVRDENSARTLARVGIAEQVSVAADPTWSTEFDWGRTPRRTSLSAPPIVVLVPRLWVFNSTWLAKLKSSLDVFLQAGWRMRVVNFGGPGDAETVCQLAAGLPAEAVEVFDASVDPMTAAASFHGARAAVAMRMHALILAVRADLPVVAIEYDAKVAHVAAAAHVNPELRVAIDASQAQYATAMSRLVESTWRVSAPASDQRANQFGARTEHIAAFTSGAAQQKEILREFVDRVKAKRVVRRWNAGHFDWISAWNTGHQQAMAGQKTAGVLAEIDRLRTAVQRSAMTEGGAGFLAKRLRDLQADMQTALPRHAAVSVEDSETEPSLPFEVGIVAARAEQTAATEVWLRAAREQGIPTSVVAVDQLSSDLRDERSRFAALVLPDRLARPTLPSFVDGLWRFVEKGGRLLVVFDAAVFSRESRYALSRSALSDLVGVDYALYGRNGEEMVRTGPVFASAASAITLGIPPGLAFSDPRSAALTPFNLRLTSYGYPELTYGSLTTTGRYDGEPLLVGPDGQLVAGIRRVGEGRVIFANLQLGYLKLDRTDGWPLHRFLRLLAVESGLPMLAPTPGGVGGMVMNIHVDARRAIEPLEQMVAKGVFENGPFSIHVTAGPDCDAEGDKLGIDVPHNREFRELLRTLTSHGHEIGSHGGWIHNHWAHNVTEDSGDRDEHLLDLNVQALSDAIGEPVCVYSAPAGLHPKWVINWLRQHEFIAHYATANKAAAPTRGYRDGELEDRRLWSFPIVTCGPAASFEEATWAGLDESTDVIPFLKSIVHFVADQHEVRMFYFHPTGIHLYENALAAWIEEARSLGERFRWYTMAGLSRFLDRREAARWTVMRGTDGDRVEAETSGTLKDLTWLVPADRYEQPRVVEGTAEIGRDGADWIVTAADGQRLEIHLAHAQVDRLRSAVRQSAQLEAEKRALSEEKRALSDKVLDLSQRLDNAEVATQRQQEESARHLQRASELEHENEVARQLHREESARHLQRTSELEREIEIVRQVRHEEAGRYAQQAEELERNMRALRAEIEFARWKINALESSFSWRISAPVRSAGTGLRNLLTVMPHRLSGPIRRTAQWVRARRPPPPPSPDQEAPYRGNPKSQLEAIREAHADKPIIVFRPLIEWNIPLHQRPQHIALELSRQGFLYLYCTPNTSFDFLDGVRQLDDACYLTDRYDLACALPGRKILHVYAADQQFGLQDLQKAIATFDVVLYEYVDELHADIAGREIPRTVLERHKLAVSDPSVICVTTASRLFDEVQAHRVENALLSTNGVEFHHFAERSRGLPAPDSIDYFVRRDERPIIGYFGAFAKWFDYEMVAHLAMTRQNYKILLIGWDYDKSIHRYNLDNVENIKIIDPVHYSVLPDYARFFDVSVIPFRINDVTQSTSPIKLFEYMALGKPIVTTAMPECRKYRSPLIANSAEHFVEQVDRALTLRHDPDYCALLREEALENVWHAKAAPIADLIRLRLSNTDSPSGA